LQIVRGTPDEDTLAIAQRFAGSGADFDLLQLEALLAPLHDPRGGDLKIVRLLDAHTRLELSRTVGAGDKGSAAQTLRWQGHSANGIREPARLALADH
jgi:hypothetical protein